MNKSSASDTVAGEAAPESDVEDDVHAYVEDWQSTMLAPRYGIFDVSSFVRWSRNKMAA